MTKAPQYRLRVLRLITSVGYQRFETHYRRRECGDCTPTAGASFGGS